MDYHIEHIIPDIKPRKIPSAKQDRPSNDLGIFYQDGIGCSKFENCFVCPLNECEFNSYPSDIEFMSNRGDGIKVW